ncbi:MAG: OmpA family protein [Candidatus Methylumidiphilus sp.]
MNRSTPYRMGGIVLAVLAQLATAPQAGAQTCAELSRAAAPAASASQSADCAGYQQCMDAGRQLLSVGAAAGAVAAFEKAVAAAGDDADQLGEAYGCLGVGYEASNDKAQAQASLEKARGVSGRKLAWVETEYKRLLSAQTLLTADDIERKLKADQAINAASATAVQAPEAPAEKLQAAQAEDSDDTDRGFAIASVEEPGQYAPKPLAAKPKPKPKAAEPQAKKTQPQARSQPTRKTAAKPAAPADSAPSLGLRINFEYGSAELTADGKAQADELGKALEKILADGRQQAILVGHTDLVGSERDNELLSQARAKAVKAYLSQSYADLASKLQDKGMGMRQPLYRDMDDATQALNRRVEVKIVQTSD